MRLCPLRSRFLPELLDIRGIAQPLSVIWSAIESRDSGSNSNTAGLAQPQIPKAVLFSPRGMEAFQYPKTYFGNSPGRKLSQR